MKRPLTVGVVPCGSTTEKNCKVKEIWLESIWVKMIDFVDRGAVIGKIGKTSVLT